MALAQLPLPEGGAVGRVALATMRGLAHHDIDVHAVVAVQHFTITGEPPADLSVEQVDVPPPGRGWRRRLAAVSRPRSELTGEFATRLDEAARGADAVHLEEVDTALGDLRAAPAALRLHYLVRRDRPVTPPWTREFRERLQFARAERRAIGAHTWLVANSAEVAGGLRRYAPGADVTVAPLALDPAWYPRAALGAGAPVGLIGTATWPPTAAAMRRLADGVWPAVRTAVPDAALVLAGRGVDRLGLDQVPGVDVLGSVPSAAGFLASLSAVVFPLERGSGAKVKVLEAMACGVPVVTTAAGAEGAASNDGLIVCEDVEAIVEATVRLLRDERERHERGQAAAAAFRQVHAPGPATEPLADLYRRMAAS